MRRVGRFPDEYPTGSIRIKGRMKTGIADFASLFRSRDLPKLFGSMKLFGDSGPDALLMGGSAGFDLPGGLGVRSGWA